MGIAFNKNARDTQFLLFSTEIEILKRLLHTILGVDTVQDEQRQVNNELTISVYGFGL